MLSALFIHQQLCLCTFRTAVATDWQLWEPSKCIRLKRLQVIWIMKGTVLSGVIFATSVSVLQDQRDQIIQIHIISARMFFLLCTHEGLLTWPAMLES